MGFIKRVTQPLCVMLVSAVCTFQVAQAQTPPSISDVPLFLNEGVPPLNMIVLGRDHKLYYEAYNDASDLDGDGTLDIRYKPTLEDGYYGYFDSLKCYTYSNTGGGRFDPTVATGTNKTCAGATEWSGDFLNYLTTSRIDALRKVLYGGYRQTDTGTTVLERSHIPQDAHSWGKEYNLGDGYDIRDYTPLALPTAGTRHLFANTTPLTASGFAELPRMRYLLNRTNRIWNWVSKERPVAHTSIDGGGAAPAFTLHDNDLVVRVRVCVASMPEPNCRQYTNGDYKPIGLLQEFGENESMYFGLLTGSYAKNTSGGVLRRNIGSIRDEINQTNGRFIAGFDGIITSLNRLRATGFGGNHEYVTTGCGWNIAPIQAGQCQMWGNPVAEMMYETLRYFGGRNNPTGAFSTTFGQGQEGLLPNGGLPVPNWENPFEDRPFCSKPFQTVVSDINPSYDSDDLPGSAFGSAGDDVGGLDVADLGQEIWDDEPGLGGTRDVFIGEAGADADGAPTPKSVSSFGNIRGLAPEEPTKQGSFYAGSVAFHGRTTEIGALNTEAADSEENVNTFAVALASPLPRIDIPVNGRVITLIPFAKSVGGAAPAPGPSPITPDVDDFQPTNQIVDFYVESLTATSGTFRVNFEDVEQGADHDMDAIARYSYVVNAGGDITVSVTSEYAAGSIIQHMGYIVSGSTADDTYLVVRDVDTTAAADTDYFLDKPNTAAELPLADARSFTPGTSGAAVLLKDPLWYAAKWGGFKEDTVENGRPDIATEWDDDGDGTPDNYFLVTNALRLAEQLTSAFSEILARTGSAASASVNSGSISEETRVYQAKFNSGNWSGQLLSFPVNDDGSLATTPEWDASREIPTPDTGAGRTIITVNSNGTTGVPFRWINSPNGIDNVRRNQLKLAAENNNIRQPRLDWLRGSRALEDQNVLTGAIQFRNRPQPPQSTYRNVLGDIVSSSPAFVGKPLFMYPDILEAQPYSAFVAANDTAAERRHMVYAGANDGMLHGFDAESGDELLAFIPGGVFPNLHELTRPSYTHRYYVDGTPTVGDAFFAGAWHTVLVGGLNKGGKSVYALDITDPDSFSEANANNTFLWEFTDATTPADMGYSYSRPAVVRLRNGKWAAVFGNGYNSANGKAVLYIVDIADGSIIRKINTNVGTGGNGLSTPALVDLNGDSIVDMAYAGDLAGNMWKFNLTGSNPAAWDVAYKPGGVNRPLFTAVDAGGVAQPITSRPEVGRGPNGAGTAVLFGTGRYLGVPDKEPTQTQTFYGILDPNTALDTDRVSGRGVLTQQQIIAEQDFTFTEPDGDTVSSSLRVTTNQTVNNRGWYLDLLQPPVPGTFQGEMQVSDSILRTGRIIFTTVIPDPDPCTVGGTSWLMELDALSGSRLAATPFDLNNDDEFDADDFVEVDIDGDGVTDLEVPVSGIQSEVGITPKPGILAGPTAEYKYTPGTTGEIQVTVENPGANATGRQSWRQIR